MNVILQVDCMIHSKVKRKAARKEYTVLTTRCNKPSGKVILVNSMKEIGLPSSEANPTAIMFGASPNGIM